jgi:hypothetical protein
MSDSKTDPPYANYRQVMDERAEFSSLTHAQTVEFFFLLLSISSIMCLKLKCNTTKDYIGIVGLFRDPEGENVTDITCL